MFLVDYITFKKQLKVFTDTVSLLLLKLGYNPNVTCKTIAKKKISVRHSNTNTTLFVVDPVINIAKVAYKEEYISIWHN